MEIIKIGKKIIYRAEKGKKVKFIDRDELYSEIVVSKETEKIEEVECE